MERLDLNAISHIAAMRQGWDEEARRRILGEYRTFLDEASRGRDEASARPTVEVDALWHLHILNSETYTDDCRRWFGRYIHHRPEPKASEATRLRMLGLMAGDIGEFASNCSSPIQQPPRPKYVGRWADCSSGDVPPGDLPQGIEAADCSARGPKQPGLEAADCSAPRPTPYPSCSSR